MPWPSVTDFTAAIQNPAICFDDPELTGGQAEPNPRGMPSVYSGNFAAVYPVSAGNRKFAVRCFTREVKDQKERYEHLDAYLRAILPPAFVDFEFHQQGIRVQGQWYPIVKMEWVNGEPLDKYVRSHLNTPNLLYRVAARWRGVASSLQGLNIAHNDLQHGNVMVQNDGSIRLVDYDGIFLPRYKGESSPEIGHHNFQHPNRTADDYDELTDNFSAIVIYLSLLALAAAPGLWQNFNNADNLIFTKADYADPANSKCFRALKNSPSPTVKHLAEYLEECCAWPLERIPYLESILERQAAPDPSPVNIAPVSSPVSVAPAPTPPAPATPSTYRDILGAKQSSPPRSGAGPAPPLISMIPCPQCNRDNLRDLVYCDSEECCTILHPGTHYCVHCGVGGPVNASYCHDCGKKVA